MPRENEIKFRKGTASQWADANPTLALGECGFEANTLRIKIGDGTTPWNSLRYIGLDGGVVGGGEDDEDALYTLSNESIIDQDRNPLRTL